MKDAAAIKTIEILKKKVKQLYNSTHQSSIHRALDSARKRMEENLRKQQLMEVRNDELRKHNEDLGLKVQERTKSIKLLLDNVGQGFFTVSPVGLIDPQYSAAVPLIFGVDPTGKHLGELLEKEIEEISGLIQTVFSEKLPFEDSVEFLPNEIEKNGKAIELSFRAIRSTNGNLESLMIIATDVTEIRELEKKGEQDRQLNKTLIKILRSRNDFIDLLEIINDLDASKSTLQEAKRMLHTLKGSFGFLECQKLQEICHNWEDQITLNYSTALYAKAIQQIQTEVDQFVAEHDQVLRLKSNRVPTLNIQTLSLHRLLNQAYQLSPPEALIKAIEELAEVSVSENFAWLNDALMGTAQRLQKNINPILWLPSDPIRPDLYRDLFKSLIHLVQNAADHGIETPDKRIQLGKPPAGTITMQLKLISNIYHLTLKDDGEGLNYDRIRTKAQEKGFEVPRTIEECQNLLIKGDFSTKDRVTETSGRGVGLEAVDQEARVLGGCLELRSEPGKGTEVIVKFKRPNRSVYSAYSFEASLESKATKNGLLHIIQKRPELIDIITNAILQTLKEHTNTWCVAGQSYFREASNRDEIKIVGILRLASKELSATLLLGFSQKTFLNIYKNMFEQSAISISGENQDLAGELLNISFGIMDPDLRKIGYELKSSFPVVLTGQLLSNKLKKVHSGALVIPFTTYNDSFYLEVLSTNGLED